MARGLILGGGVEGRLDLAFTALELFGLGSIAEVASAPDHVVVLADRRREARAARDFDESDRLRAEIEAEGWEVRDDPEGYRLVPLQ